MSKFAKLKIKPEAESKFAEIEVLFNPNTYSVTKTVSWTPATGSTTSSTQNQRGKNAPILDFGVF